MHTVRKGWQNLGYLLETVEISIFLYFNGQKLILKLIIFSPSEKLLICNTFRDKSKCKISLKSLQKY